MPAVRLGLIDSGLPAQAGAPLLASRRFGADGAAGPAGVDRAGHATLMLGCLVAACPGARVHVAQVFDGRRPAAPASVAAAIDWLAGEGVELIHMSLGVAAPHAGLRRACQRAAAAGIVLVASAPARGPCVYPAAFAECIAATGDARCAAGEVSWLASARAEFGACPFAVPGRPDAGGGASFAAARVSGALAGLLAEGIAAPGLRAALAERATLRGPERRLG